MKHMDRMMLQIQICQLVVSIISLCVQLRTTVVV